MQWESWSAFWHMGGAAWFVWGSYAVAALLIVVEILTLRQGLRNTRRRLWRLRRAAPQAHTSPTLEASDETSH